MPDFQGKKAGKKGHLIHHSNSQLHLAISLHRVKIFPVVSKKNLEATICFKSPHLLQGKSYEYKRRWPPRFATLRRQNIAISNIQFRTQHASAHSNAHATKTRHSLEDKISTSVTEKKHSRGRSLGNLHYRNRIIVRNEVVSGMLQVLLFFAESYHDIGSGPAIGFEADNSIFFGIFKNICKTSVTMIGLVEGWKFSFN